MTDTTTNELDQLKEESLQLGRRLGLLLATAELPAEQKEAWIALIPEMSATQLADLAQALERFIPDADEQGFADLARELTASQTKYQKAVAMATSDAQQSLNAVEREIV